MATSLKVYRASALGISTELYSVGYVVFSKSKCCNNIYKWINKAILFKAIRNKTEVVHISPESMTWFELDGEPVQIEDYEDPVLLNNHLQRHLYWMRNSLGEHF